MATETERLLGENPHLHAWWFLARAYHSVALVLNRFFDERGITGAQYGVLRCVADAGDEGLMLSDLSKRLMVTCGNITGVVDRLEQAGYLRRERSPEDRRVIRARLTPEGHALFQQIRPDYHERVRRLMEGLAPEEQQALGDSCERLHRFVEELPVLDALIEGPAAA